MEAKFEAMEESRAGIAECEQFEDCYVRRSIDVISLASAEATQI